VHQNVETYQDYQDHDQAAVGPCQGCRRPTRSRFCPGCASRVDENLAAIPGLYLQLGLILMPGSQAGDRVSGSRTAPPPCRLEPLSLRAKGGIVGILTDWEDGWRALLGWSLTPLRGSIEKTVAGSAAFLKMNWPWCADKHPAAYEFASEINELIRTCGLQINGPSDYKRIGDCPTLCDDGYPCGTTLWANPYLDSIRCRSCESVWDRPHWLLLGGTLRTQVAA
jgi:hypothetical protein